MSATAEYVVDFPTLGFLVGDWIEQHCIIPDGFHKGKPYVMADWQLWITLNHYRVKPDAVWNPADPVLAASFHYRRSQIVAPQKTGKGPWSAAIITNEAVGPSVFAGWAQPGDFYDCAEHGCDCGWTYEYEPGDPMGIPRPSPLIQLTALSKDQTDNVFRPLQAMFRGGGLEVAATRTGEEFIRLPGDGRIDVVTSSAKTKLGNPVTFVLQDETGLWRKTNGMAEVAKTQRRGLAGMQGRSIETTNCWDPSEESVAQTTFESLRPDIFRFYREPPADLSYKNKVERRRIHKFVYEGSWWVNLDSIEAEAAELLETDPANAERFFGNRRVRGAGSWLPEGLWESRTVAREVLDGASVCGGFDGSETDDWTAIRLETMDGFQFTPTYGPDSRPTIWNPAEWDGRVPRSEVHAAWAEIADRYSLVRVYCDPPKWQTEVESWALEYGDDVFVEFATYRGVPMFAALERTVTDLASGGLSHDECALTRTHVGNARKKADGKDRYILTKPSNAEKIDIAMTSVLAHEARADAVAAGWTDVKPKRRMVVR